MKKHWKKSLFRITLWLVAEIYLNYLGIDDLADYSEFIFERPVIAKTVNGNQTKNTHNRGFGRCDSLIGGTFGKQIGMTI